MNFKNLKLKTKIILGSCCSLALVVILSFISFQSTSKLLNNNEWVTHTYKVIQEAKNIEASAVDMETGMRGYLLAGKEEFLDPYKAGGKSFHELTVSLQKTVDDNPAQVELLDEIQSTINDWETNVTEPMIALRREIGDAKTMDDMAALVAQAKGKTYFDKFRGQIDTFIQREQKLLIERKKATQQMADSATVNWNTIKETTGWVEHTYEVIASARAILASAVDMETGMRGYLLAGREEFLDPYKAGGKSFYELTADLQKTVDDNPAQVKLLDEIQATINTWEKSVTEPMIALRREIGDAKSMNHMAKLVGEARGKKYFDKFRNQIATFTDREVELIQIRSASAEATARNTKLIIVFGTAITILLSMLIAYFLGTIIAKPVAKVSASLKEIAEGDGDLTVRLDVSSKDEVGDLAKWFNVLMDNLQAMIKQISEGVDTVTASSTELSAISQQMSASTEQTTGKTVDVANATEEMSTMINGVVAATEQAATNANMIANSAEQMSSTIDEIARNTDKGSRITGDAVQQAANASEQVNALGSAANEIGKVTETITEISEQTNLLALNATIEAARAGEAGKGFAVVANEIKDLAKQTAEATQEISTRIEGVQTTASGTVDTIGQITKVIDDVNSIVGTISSAIEEQNATTKEIATNVTQVSDGISEVTTNVAQSSTVANDIAADIAGVSQASEEIASGSRQIDNSATELSKLSEQLKGLVGRFRV